MNEQARLFEDSSLFSDFGDELDFYETPRWAVEAIIPFLRTPSKGRWHLIEPAAGRGALLSPEILKALDPDLVTAFEVHSGRYDELSKNLEAIAYPIEFRCEDFLQADVPRDGRRSRLVLMNPPYSKPRDTIGLEFVERALKVAGDFGIVAALLPLDFATGVERCSRIHDKYLGSVYPLRRRPHFGGPHSGQRPFAWFVWDLLRHETEWRVIG